MKFNRIYFCTEFDELLMLAIILLLVNMPGKINKKRCKEVFPYIVLLIFPLQLQLQRDSSLACKDVVDEISLS